MINQDESSRSGDWNYPAGRRGIDGAEADGGLLGTCGGGFAPPPGRWGTIGAALFIALIACAGVIPIAFIPEFRVDAAWYICCAYYPGVINKGNFIGKNLKTVKCQKRK